MLMPNVEKGTFRELLFHEVGGHGGLQQRPQVNKLMDRVDLAEQGNKDARQAAKMPLMHRCVCSRRQLTHVSVEKYWLTSFST